MHIPSPPPSELNTRHSRGRSWPLRGVLQRLLRHLQVGSLSITLPGGSTLDGQGPQPGPRARLTLHRWRPVWRLLTSGDIGLARSYRDGDWSTPDLTALLEVGLRNEAAWGSTLHASLPVRWLHRLAHGLRRNTRRGSRDNIAFHYDLGNEFYAEWLDASMLYSSAMHVTGAESLEEAQAIKLQRILDELDLREDSQVLEIGCGWGALAERLALAAPRGHVTALTLSQEQLRHTTGRVRAAGVGRRVDAKLQDYRDEQGRYDRIVSIEMLEAVGEAYWPAYFAALHGCLRPGGVAVVQAITIAQDQFARYRAEPDFIQRFIFPGGMLPTAGIVQAEAERAGLRLVSREAFGPSYALTLAEWRHRFLRAWPRIEALGFNEAFRRLWVYYLCYCEAGFRTGRVDVALYTLERADSDADAGSHGRAAAESS
ncbi:cyclopropane-fatty-acyl-phospholipid synthase family protein [Acidovorax sp. Leaf160]|uniref:SAM-dependent methyltransferase n=1 Tax=Acidovorax sp. Leaf160 TaxID=1736280 RepID=UPI0006FB0C98|nr:cyclopropane-fatty-acyl-phospholipid synthase family protein [Acidovorax sp. Leaf160]KQR60298.1 hypothetical protein ASF94_17870 [Acidovorax sp. Leaf160]